MQRQRSNIYINYYLKHKRSIKLVLLFVYPVQVGATEVNPLN